MGWVKDPETGEWKRTADPPGVGGGWPSSEWTAVKIGAVVAIVILGVLWLNARMTAQPEYKPASESSLTGFAGTAFSCFVAVLVLSAVGMVGYFGIRAWLSIERAGAEVDRAKAEAKMVKPAENGLFPLVDRNGRLVNPNAAPAGIVEANGDMPDPQTEDARAAAVRSSFVQVAAGTKGKMALPGMAAMPVPVVALPPVQVLDGNELDAVERLLLEAGKGEE